METPMDQVSPTLNPERWTFEPWTFEPWTYLYFTL